MNGNGISESGVSGSVFRGCPMCALFHYLFKLWPLSCLTTNWLIFSRKILGEEFLLKKLIQPFFVSRDS